MEILKILERSRSAIHPGLKKMQTALAEIAYAPDHIPTILIGGTNGKGTTAGILWRLLALSGAKCGLYTSPHVLNFSERIQCSHHPLSLAELENELHELKNQLKPSTYDELTFFELTTVLALFVFRKLKCDFIILEIGLGGRLDACNAVEPLASCIVSIDYDHQEWLGHTLEEITYEKLGIARSNKELFWADRGQRSGIEKTLRDAIITRNILLRRMGIDFDYNNQTASIKLPTLDTWNYRLPNWLDRRAPILKNNFVLASAIFYWLVHHPSAKSLCKELEPALLAQKALNQFDSTSGPWPFSFLGRMQNLHVRGNNKSWDFHLDVCHNIASVEQFVRSLEATGLVIRKVKKIPGLVSILRDKDLEAMLALLREVFDPFMIFKLDHERSIRDEQLTHHKDLVVYDNFQHLWSVNATSLPSPIAVCGSFYAVGTVIDYFKAFPEDFSGQSTLLAHGPS